MFFFFFVWPGNKTWIMEISPATKFLASSLDGFLGLYHLEEFWILLIASVKLCPYILLLDHYYTIVDILGLYFFFHNLAKHSWENK